ncbi:MAG: ABC transporter permease [Pseudolabrys sp.]|nr:ABC transporter permease [Pseudolabrys sp.]MCW5683820.1 ABC transporter permease [Pseudolabrys sp.]
MSRSLRILAVFLGFLLVWEAGTRLFDVPTWFLPSPSVIFVELRSDPMLYLVQSLDTLATTMLGFGAAFVLGVLLAIAIVYSRVLENTLYTLLVSFNSIPKIALAPLFIIWLGTGLQSKVAVSFLIAFFPIVIDMVLGLRSTDPEALNLFKTMHGSSFHALTKIRFPNALPYMFSGMKVAISLALVGAVAGEFIASQSGLGYVILTAQGMFFTPRVFAAILLLGVMGTILFYLVDLAERLVCPWHVAHREEEVAAAARG